MFRRPPRSPLFPYTPLSRSATGRVLVSTRGPVSWPRWPSTARGPRALRRGPAALTLTRRGRSEEHTSELQSRQYLVCRLLLEKKKILFALHPEQAAHATRDR